MHIKILESATQDLMHGYRFYEQQEYGLGGYFLDPPCGAEFISALEHRDPQDGHPFPH
jgi:hypothetical protein